MKFASMLKGLVFVIVVFVYTENSQAQEYLGLTGPYSITVPPRNTYTLQEVRDAIIFGARSHQWHVESEAPGLIRFRLGAQGEQYVLRIEIAYDTKSYSVKYLSSEGLSYVKGTATANQASSMPVPTQANSTPIMNPMSGAIPAASSQSSTESTNANSTPIMNPMSGGISNSSTVNNVQQKTSIDYRYVRWMNTLVASINRELNNK